MSDTPDSIGQDASDLQRGVTVNLAGYVLKLANPILLILVVRLYGATAFGIFTLVQAVMMLGARFAALGLDKALLWWVPRQDGARAREGIRPALWAASTGAALVTVALLLASSTRVLAWAGVSTALSTPLRLMALGTIPQVVTDLLLHACMGRRRMEAQVLVKDTLVPTLLVAGGLALYWSPARAVGLPLAYLVSTLAGVLAAWFFFARVFRGTPWPEGEGRRPPPDIVRYAGPMWLAEMSNSLLLRMDTTMVAALVGDLALVGVYAIVVRIANQIRDIRRSFDPIVLAIASRIGHVADPARLAAGFSYATFLVTVTQIPVFVFLLVFARDLMPLYGEGFGGATTPIVILCAFWLFNGVASLAGIVVAAYGKSRLTLFNTLFAIAVQAAASFVLIPRYQLVGAALSVGIAYTAQGCLQVVQMRRVTGGWNYNRSVFGPMMVALFGGVAMAAIVWLGKGHGMELTVRIAAFAAFALVYLPGAWRLWRRQKVQSETISAREA
jgi:O-antigen/teichoic acid export membrane protein